jgi:hypothetical protein
LIIFTLLITVFFAFLALVVDSGFLYGQRRYDQNGADAAVLASAREMAVNVAPLSNDGTTVFIDTSDATVFQTVRQYGGLNPSNASNAPTGTNQNSNMDSNNTLTVSLEYAADGSTWCYSPSGAAPPGSPGEAACTLYLGTYPPLPTNNPYKVRVTVGSTTSNNLLSFLQGAGNTTMATSAIATETILGSPTFLGTGSLIPTVAPDCQVAANLGDALYELWGSKGNSQCGINFGSWDSLVDLSDDSIWCMNYTVGRPTYKYINLLPTGSYKVGDPNCSQPPGWKETWNRTGFVKDNSYPGTLVKRDDVDHWITVGFGGAITVGNNLPTYLDNSNGGGGDLGSNVADAFYCSPPSVSADNCSDFATDTYFFAQNQSGFQDHCTDGFSLNTNGSGCRDATVITWTNPLATKGAAQNATKWDNNTKTNPDQIQVARLLNFRFYCDHDGSGYCTSPPKSIQGNSGKDTVWGRFVAPFSASCPGCNGGPSLNGDTVTMSG